MLDGELVIGREDGLDFGELRTRLSRRRDGGHPLLGATDVAFDLLAWGISLLDHPFRERRAILERHPRSSDVLAITPQTYDYDAAQAWLSFNTRGVEGVIAKRGNFPYR